MPHISSPSGFHGIAATDMFRLVVCSQSPGKDNHLARPSDFAASVGCGSASDFQRSGPRALPQQPGTAKHATAKQHQPGDRYCSHSSTPSQFSFFLKLRPAFLEFSSVGSGTGLSWMWFLQDSLWGKCHICGLLL